MLGLCVAQVAGAERLLFSGYSDERRIKLHEGRVDRGVRLMAGVAGHARWDLLRRAVVAECEERPAALEAHGILHMQFQAHDGLGLEFPRFVDRALGEAFAVLHGEDRTVGPGPRFLERAHAVPVDEDVVEHMMIHPRATGRITHVHAGAEKRPIAIVFGHLNAPVG